MNDADAKALPIFINADAPKDNKNIITINPNPKADPVAYDAYWNKLPSPSIPTLTLSEFVKFEGKSNAIFMF